MKIFDLRNCKNEQRKLWGHLINRVNDLIWDDSNMGHYEENMPVSQ